MPACSLEWFECLSALHDREVSDEDAVRITAHVAACAACRRASAAVGRISVALERHRSTDVPPAAAGPRRTALRVVAGGLVAAAAAAAVFAAPRGLPPAMADELVTHHVRGFARERPCDFESSDPAAVARWVEGELGYHASVQPPPGARLLGARACTLDGTRTAALMYQRSSGEPLTVFVPPPGSNASAVASRLSRAHGGCTKASLGNEVCPMDDGALAVGRPL